MITKETIARIRDFVSLGERRLYGLRLLVCLVLFFNIFMLSVRAQETITIGGNVYGGGNQGKVGGNTTVTVRAGRLNKVFAGARMADVGGRSFLNVDGENATTDIFIVEAYGGNDIAGTIGASEEATTVPEELTDILQEGETKADHPQKNEIDNSWKTFVRTSRSSKTEEGNVVEDKAIIIGTLFGGGNGEYFYNNDGDTHEIYASQKDYEDGKAPIAFNNTGFTVPELPKTYLEIKGGCIAHLYGGGNNATVTQNTTIFIDNQSDDLETLAYKYADVTGMSIGDVLNYLMSLVKLSTFQGDYTNWKYNFARIFGGNNKADMAIRPTWNLQAGMIRDLYSGGNRGRMTNEDGILLDVNPTPDGEGKTDKLLINNVYGGCRMADVRPKTNEWDPTMFNPVKEEYGDYKDALVVDNTRDKEAGYFFPPNFAAHTLIQGGDINNVYGGNDIMGRVYFGNAVGIATSIRGDVYGGGNGAYAYTDHGALKDNPEYSDFYYNVLEQSSEEALLDIRPNAEQVSLMLRGTEDKPTIIGGSVYCGGNCATLKQDPEHAGLPDYPITELKLGSYVYADNVYLGNNGAGMESKNLLKLYQSSVSDYPFNSMRLTNPDVMKTYMEGVAMNQVPSLITENTALGDRYTYKPYSSYIGSLYLGGNVGSMTYPGKNTMNFDAKITVYNKVVGGCNKANVPEQFDDEDNKLNARYEGGILGASTELAPDGLYKEGKDNAGNILDRLEMNFNGLRIEPKRWKVKRDALTYEPILTDGKLTYQDKEGHDLASLIATCPDCSGPGQGHACLEWHTVELTNTYPAVADGSTLEKGKKYFTSDVGTGEFTATGSEVADGTNYYELKRVYKEIANGAGTGTASEVDKNRRLLDGDVYGGCYTSGHVNGNIVINVEDSLHNRHKIFDVFEGEEEGEDILYARDSYTITKRNSGVLLNEQGMDVMGDALNVFGGGYGAETEIWGSTTINQKKGYTFQIFGGGEMGAIGHGNWNGTKYTGYAYDSRYSTTINLHGKRTGDPRSKDKDNPVPMAECEFIYGGGFEGLIAGDTHINLGNGRIFNTFGGCYNANVLGHAETYIGRGVNYATGEEEEGFPWVRDYTYGGNDLGGEIEGQGVFSDIDTDLKSGHLRSNKVRSMVHNPNDDAIPNVLKANAYTEYRQGRAGGIYGGCFGDYDYSREFMHVALPRLKSTFVNFRPTASPLKANGSVGKVLGGCEGYPRNRDGDKIQDRSYVLIDIPSSMTNYQTMEVFGSGSYNGLGMRYTYAQTTDPAFDLDEASAIIDLMDGKIANAYGGSYNEGNTRRTVVNVPEGSTIWMYSLEDDEDADNTKHVKQYGNIFGGAYGTQILPPCDVYESNVNYKSEDAIVNGYIYGGNNTERRTLYTKVNIFSPVYSNKEKGYFSSVFGAGKGKDTWTEYTEVNLLPGAMVYEAYGGGMMGHVLNSESVQRYMQMYKDEPSPDIVASDSHWNDRYGSWAEAWEDAWQLGAPEDGYFMPNADYTNYITNASTNLNRINERPELDDRTASQFGGVKKYNANVIIHEDAYVGNYAYGGGYGKSSEPLSGDVYGSTYIALLGGVVKKDIYAAGTSGGVYDLFEAKNFTASANAYVKGGMCRNVYGGGWEGNVGQHVGDITASPAADIPGVTYVVIGDQNGTSFKNGIPAIQRNAYGGGEGGAVYGTANLTLNNGYIGYVHLNADEEQDESGQIVSAIGKVDRYEDKIIDETYRDKDTKAFIPNTNLYDAGCIFGGGYIDNSSVDKTRVNIYGGHVRNSVFGGGEVAAVGRGTANKVSGGFSLTGLYRPGKTNVEMMGGHVRRNVYGGGRGYNNLGKHGSLNTDGFVFGQTEVHVHGGEVGTNAGLADGDGNVFGGGDIGFVYSAYENPDGTFGKGVKKGERYKSEYQGYYFQHSWEGVGEGGFVKDGTEYKFTEDCKVLIEPQCKVTGDAVSFTSIHYKQGETVSSDDRTWLEEGNPTEYAKIGPDGKVSDEGGITFSRSYARGAYVPIAALNTMKNRNADGRWGDLDASGIVIHNAVFAGGNTQPGSATATYVNTASIFGNATASVNDVYNRDLITLGTRHTGGLYGDGNMTFVDGYRELNITNYGTDYYSINSEISNYAYHNEITEREQAYYELKFTCMKECQDKDGTTYKPASGKVKASTITYDDLLTLFLEYNEEIKDYTSYQYDGIAVLKQVNGEWVPNTDPGASFWVESGVITAYAGRLMNSIQRADLCGVWGSRMVMKGAQDRVPEEVDYTNYTINRVREVSLNKVTSPAGDTTDKDKEHGNYFGIYSVVNYLGALSSDFDFGGDDGGGDIRITDNEDEITYKCDVNGKKYGTEATFYDWKQKWWNERRRNNGNSHNKVALASGVYLELTTELSTGDDLYEKDWGPITGVVELDLINVAPGIGGGFVYAKNIHGVRSKSGHKNTTLTALNKGAATQWDFDYTTEDATKHEWQTSGNFVHSTQVIIDDCYNISSKYKSGYMPPDGVPAHYWYIKGSVYVYDQYISAYTGIPNAYSEAVEIPLTITAASHGKMTLLNVQPNYYAYYSSRGVELESGKKVVINDKEYYKNDPISFWDWYMLPPSERALFVSQTYVNCVAVKIDGEETLHEAGTIIMNQEEFNKFKESSHTYKDAAGNPIKDADKEDADNDYIFRTSNEVSHDNGYILTYKVTNPGIWDTWYTEYDDMENTAAASREKSTDLKDLEVETNIAGNKVGPNNGPTYRLNTTGYGMLLGQREYEKGNIIGKEIYDTYQNVATTYPSAITATSKTQAEFEPAYIVTQQVTITDGTGATHHKYVGSVVSKTEADPLNSSSLYYGKAEPAYVCTSTIQLSKTDYIYVNDKMTVTAKSNYITDNDNAIKAIVGRVISKMDDLSDSELTALTSDKKKDLQLLLAAKKGLNEDIVEAYYCTKDGSYGGDYYQSGRNYRGLEAWSSMSEDDRSHFTFNYDALDLLIDPSYTSLNPTLVANKYQYDGKGFTNATQAATNPAGYSIIQPVDYTASYNSTTPLTLTNAITVKHDGTPASVTTVTKDDELTREVFESLNNEQRHYAAIAVKNGKEVTTGEGLGAVTKYLVYVVNQPFQIGSTPYAIGSVISAEAYEGLADKSSITTLTFPSSAYDKTYYYCRESYKVGYNGDGVDVAKTETEIDGIEVFDENGIETTVNASGYTTGAQVPSGLIIDVDQYELLEEKNQQKNFTIHGESPTETSTLYVARNSDIYDLSKEKIITVVYQYEYDEVQASGNVTPICERHVVNIHLQFKSGVPIVDNIQKPDIILPGEYVTMKEPGVTPGAYEILGGGWELFEDISDAESHTNGIDYNPHETPLYWYQDDWYVSYYAKTYLGRTYSNSVPVSVANYHDIADVMSEKTHHMHVDHPDVKRDSKIYINDYTSSSQNGLDIFKSLYDLSLVERTYDGDGNPVAIASGTLKDHVPMNERVKGGANLEFFLRTDIDHSSSSWTPIGDAGLCFEGTLHGDGHRLTGLDHSLFGELCGNVYNLGVMGSFTGAGVAEQGRGYVESCWISTSSNEVKTNKPVFGNPNRTDPSKPYQLVNCYYQEEESGVTNPYTPHSGSSKYGTATRKPKQAFYNGEVTYDLNSFYLNKRYYHGKKQNAGTSYRYLHANADGTLPDDAGTGYYPTTGFAQYSDLGYVEERFADGDFRYAVGYIPDNADIRFRSETKTHPDTHEEYEEKFFAPIWPDDYLFFGQTLNYGYQDGEEGRPLIAHQEWPSVINRSSGRVDMSENGNRVYRAPAYFRNSTMDVAHFNPNAFLAQTKKDDASIKAYPYMTAIDFAGLNGDLSGGYKQGLQSGRFYAPLLDDDGLTAITNCDETHNLLVYTPAEASADGYFNKKTYDVLTDYFFDPEFNTYYDNNAACTQYSDGKPYNRVAMASTDRIYGHLVHHDLQAKNDHLLVDRHDFDCPISYTFASNKRMWYQRIPSDEEYVDHDKGWQGISLPFIAELTTTHQKGEITHFYGGSEVSKNGTGTKIGHEYWLRGLEENGDLKLESGEPGDEDDVLEAIFNYPTNAGGKKEVENTFLWDYYYEGVHGHKDKNLDEYQTYYKHTRTYPDYAFLNRGTPYILGLPGTTYYEFDLSGEFFSYRLAITTATPYPEQLEKQVITFASAEGADIMVSDLEKGGVKQTYSSKEYYFKPNYLNIPLTTTDYVLNADGDQYEKVTSSAAAVPFRPFFRSSGSSGVKEFRRIKFSKETARMIGQEDNDEIDNNGELRISAKLGRIIVTSTLTEAKDVVIVSAAGALIDRYTIQPGETIEIPVNASGVYVVNRKKLSVKIRE